MMMITLTNYKNAELLIHVRPGAIESIRALSDTGKNGFPVRTRVDTRNDTWIVQEEPEEILGRIRSADNHAAKLAVFGPMLEFIEKLTAVEDPPIPPRIREEAGHILNLLAGTGIDHTKGGG